MPRGGVRCGAGASKRREGRGGGRPLLSFTAGRRGRAHPPDPPPAESVRPPCLRQHPHRVPAQEGENREAHSPMVPPRLGRRPVPCQQRRPHRPSPPPPLTQPPPPPHPACGCRRQRRRNRPHRPPAVAACAAAPGLPPPKRRRLGRPRPRRLPAAVASVDGARVSSPPGTGVAATLGGTAAVGTAQTAVSGGRAGMALTDVRHMLPVRCAREGVC